MDHLPSSNTFLALYVRLGFTTISNMHSHLAQSVVLITAWLLHIAHCVTLGRTITSGAQAASLLKDKTAKRLHATAGTRRHERLHHYILDDAFYDCEPGNCGFGQGDSAAVDQPISLSTCAPVDVAYGESSGDDGPTNTSYSSGDSDIEAAYAALGDITCEKTAEPRHAGADITELVARIQVLENTSGGSLHGASQSAIVGSQATPKI